MNTYQNLRLYEWIARGRELKRIRQPRTVVLAYCMDEREAIAWIADIVTGKKDEEEALVFMERCLQYQS